MICDLVFGQTERKSDPGRWRGCRVYLPHLSFEHPKNWEVSFTPPWVCYAKMLIAYEIGCFCFFLQKFGGEDPLGERDNASWVAGRKLYLEKSPPLKPMEATVLPPPHTTSLIIISSDWIQTDFFTHPVLLTAATWLYMHISWSSAILGGQRGPSFSSIGKLVGSNPTLNNLTHFFKKKCKMQF